MNWNYSTFGYCQQHHRNSLFALPVANWHCCTARNSYAGIYGNGDVIRTCSSSGNVLSDYIGESFPVRTLLDCCTAQRQQTTTSGYSSSASPLRFSIDEILQEDFGSKSRRDDSVTSPSPSDDVKSNDASGSDGQFLNQYSMKSSSRCLAQRH